MTLTLFESASLVELLIYGFIGINLVLSGSYLIRRGFQRLAAARGI